MLVLLWAAENHVGYLGIPLLLICPITSPCCCAAVRPRYTDILFCMTASGPHDQKPY